MGSRIEARQQAGRSEVVSRSTAATRRGKRRGSATARRGVSVVSENSVGLDAGNRDTVTSPAEGFNNDTAFRFL